MVGNACAWSPAAMGDSGAAVSLIGTELLKMLPPDAVVKFRVGLKAKSPVTYAGLKENPWP